MFQLKNIEFYYEKENKILSSLSLNILKGQLYVVLGENGSGKSTLLMLLKGILQEKKGVFIYQGEKIERKKISTRDYIQEVGYVFQNPDMQIVGTDVESDLEFGPLNLGWDYEKVKNKVQEIMTLFEIDHLKEKDIHKLSYGEKKSTTFAGVLAMDPQVLLLDEPTTWLDPYNKRKLIEILSFLKSSGKTIVITTHDMEFAKTLNCNYIFLKNGGVAHEGGIEVFEDMELLNKCRLI